MITEDGIELKDEERQTVECWTRVMGYFRPVDNWNIGKQQEFKDRQNFKQSVAMKYVDKEENKR